MDRLKMTGAPRGRKPYRARHLPADNSGHTMRSDYLFNAQCKGGDACPQTLVTEM